MERKIDSIKEELRNTIYKIEYEKIKNKGIVNPELIKEKNKIKREYALELLKIREEEDNDKCKRR